MSSHPPTPAGHSDDDAPLTHADGLTVGLDMVFRMDPGFTAAAVCDPDDPDDPSWVPAGPPPHTAAATCCLYRPGHHVHWIQAKKGLRSPARPFTLLDSTVDTITVADEDGALATWRLHDTAIPTALLLLEGTSTLYLHEHELLRAGRSLMYPCRDPQRWQDCRPHP
jgi:hypothetical protein